MRIVYAWRPSSLDLSYWLTNCDGHFETFGYLARYYDVSLVVGGFEGVFQRNQFTVYGCGQDAQAFAAKIADLKPDALICYGAAMCAEWGMYRAAAPQAFFCLDYGGGPLMDYDGTVLPMLRDFDHVFVAHETQATMLRDQGVRATKARGVPLHRYRPMPEVPKLWHVFCPTTFVAGKRPSLVAQYCEQYAPPKPSLFCGWMEDPTIVDMVRCGGIPLNKPDVPWRNGIQLGGRVPYPIMPLLYNASEVVVCGSEEEAGPWVVMEALACGTPAIVMSDCEWGVAQECKMNAHRRSALRVVDPHPDAIHAAIEDLNIALWPVEEMQRSAREIAVRLWDWWPMYVEIDRVLKNGVAFKQAGQEQPV